jgi:hypothetical protein
MRSILIAAACVLGLAATAAAQDGAGVFVSAEPNFRSMSSTAPTGPGTTFGLDLTVGIARSWKGFQPIFQGGRLIDVAPAELIPRSFPPSFASETSTWYGAAGARFLAPRVWRFQPYAEATTGVGHMNSKVVTTESLFRMTRFAPVTNVGAGAELRLGQHFVIDAGYRKQGFFGDADVERRGPRLAFGVRF